MPTCRSSQGEGAKDVPRRDNGSAQRGQNLGIVALNPREAWPGLIKASSHSAVID